MADKLVPNDPRVEHKTATLNGKTYSYIVSTPPDGTPIHNTLFLIHGWPDMAFGWRYQVPFLTSLGLRVVVPNMMGYAGTDAPEPLEYYTYKSTADDIAALAAQLGLDSIILGGHDWGGAIVFRIALHYPNLVSAIFSICTPFAPPRKEYVNAAKVLPNFAYQNQLAGPEVEKNIVGEEKLRQFLNGMYGGRSPDGNVMFSVSTGVLFDKLPEIGPSPLLSKEEVDYYVQQYARNGMHGPLNWYRTGELNFKDEGELAEKFIQGFKFHIPTLFVAGKKDAALPPSMSKGMENFFDGLRKEEVDAGHWALWEKPKEINAILGDWFGSVLAKGKASL